MRQPLIGLNIMKIEAPSILDLIAVQLTGSGDLFYQFLTSKGANEADDDSHIQSNGIFGMVSSNYYFVSLTECFEINRLIFHNGFFKFMLLSHRLMNFNVYGSPY